MIDKAVYAQEIFRTVSVKLNVMLVIKTVFTPEVGNTALCRYSGSAKEDNMLALSDNPV